MISGYGAAWAAQDRPPLRAWSYVTGNARQPGQFRSIWGHHASFWYFVRLRPPGFPPFSSFGRDFPAGVSITQSHTGNKLNFIKVIPGPAERIRVSRAGNRSGKLLCFPPNSTDVVKASIFTFLIKMPSIKGKSFAKRRF